MKLNGRANTRLFVRCIIIASLVSLTTACEHRAKTEGQKQTEIDSADFAHQVHFDYAETIKVNNYPNYKELIILSPERTDTLATYILYPRWRKRPTEVHQSATMIPVPIERIACLSTTQVGAIAVLGATDRLVGASKLNYINSPEVRQRISEGKVIEIARGMHKNYESILMARPEVLLQDLTHRKAQDAELIKAGTMPVLSNAWKERNLLGRAEWLKLSGLLLGLNQRADSIFKRISIDYQEASRIATNKPDTIPILWGHDYKGMWHIPGEYSYPTAMFRDAGLKFDYMPDKVDSTPVSFEYVFSRHRHKKIWISVMTGKVYTKKDFLALNERYSYFDVAGEGGKIFLDRKRVNEYGGNDYWESGPYRPDLILKDLIKMTRPELLPDYELYYFIELQ